VDLKDIKAIVDLMKKNALSDFELEHQDFKIKLKRGPGAVPIGAEEAPMFAAPPVAAVPPSPATRSAIRSDIASASTEIRSNS